MKRVCLPSLSTLVLLILSACADSTPLAPRTEPHATQPPTTQPVPPPKTPVPTGPDYIYVANADGTAAAPLVAGDWPSWSPDGKRIAFQDSSGIAMINVDGSGRVELTAGRTPSWSPDGTRLIFANASGIAVINVNGSALQTLVRHDFRTDTDPASDMGVAKPSFSPDGRKIVFEHLGDGDMQPAQIFIMNSDGSNVTPLTSDPQNRRYAESDPAWSPDGSQIAFWSYGYGVAFVTAYGGVPVTLYQDFPRVAYGTKPSFSEDGRTISFTYDRLSDGPSIWTIPAQGGYLKELINYGWDASWSPDRQHIAFVHR